MNCNFKLMMKIAAGVVVLLALLYIAVPATQAVISSNGALLVLLLLCPLAMLIMALSMNGKNGDSKSASETANAPPRKSGTDDNI